MSSFVTWPQEESATERMALADDGRDGGRGENAVLAHQNLGHAVASAHLDDDLQRLLVPVAAIAANHKRAALHSGVDEALRTRGESTEDTLRGEGSELKRDWIQLFR